jgi:hypothetical protein
MAQEFSPTEIFKRATAATLRAIAERDDVTVGFGPEPAGQSGARVRLPNPPRDLPAEEAAQLRGAADSVALRLRYHDAAVHSKRVPSGPLARAVFDAVEQARVEALGSRRMAGVASNLEAMLDEHYRRQGYERITERTESGRRPRRGASSICGAPGSNRASARISANSTARSSIRTPMRGRPASCCRISTSILAKPTSRRIPKSSRAARNRRAKTKARARAPPLAPRLPTRGHPPRERPRTRRTPPNLVMAR